MIDQATAVSVEKVDNASEAPSLEFLSERLFAKMGQLESVDLGRWNDLLDEDKDFYRHCVAEVLNALLWWKNSPVLGSNL